MKQGMNSVAATVLGGMLTFALASSAAMAAEQRIGAVVQPDYSGATALANGAADAHAIRYRDDVHALDTVETGAKGSTSLEFLDETRIDIGPAAEVRLDEFVYDPQSTVGGGEVSFAVGAFRYVGGRMTTEENMRLKTPTATMVIRGTELVIYVWPDGRTEVNVISGAVEVSACHGGGGGSQLAKAGTRVVVTPACSVSKAPSRKIASGEAALHLPDPDAKERGKGQGKGGDREAGSQPGGGRPSGGGSSGGGSSGGNTGNKGGRPSGSI